MVVLLGVDSGSTSGRVDSGSTSGRVDSGSTSGRVVVVLLGV